MKKALLVVLLLVPILTIGFWEYEAHYSNHGLHFAIPKWFSSRARARKEVLTYEWNGSTNVLRTAYAVVIHKSQICPHWTVWENVDYYSSTNWYGSSCSPLVTDEEVKAKLKQ